ncbi:hypothetical protein BDY24DRAFT_380424 [Mrakia frigida]|uniref:uncharacterized protein n=1 Tax=Mrakia frigida TaxID=29902 RepID=UPI003FCC1B29
MRLTINIDDPSNITSTSRTINVNNDGQRGIDHPQQTRAQPISTTSHFPPPPIATISKEDAAWAAMYPVPRDLDISAKPWLPGPHKSFTFINAIICDPKEGTETKGYTLKVKNGKIFSFVPANLVDDLWEAEVEGATVVDVKGKWMSPGLIDCHTHVTAAPGSANLANIMGDPRDAIMLRSTHVLKGMLGRGFTTVRDVGGASKAHADATDEWLVPGPRVFQGGPILSQTGGHGDSTDPNGDPASGCHGHGGGVVDGVDACLRAARDAMRKGADHIKVCTSGGVGSITDALEAIQFTIPELQAITTTVRQMGGRLVTSHCYTSAGIRHSIEGGVGGIEHGNQLDKPTAKLMAEKGIYLTPTLAVHTMLSKEPFIKFLIPSQVAKNELVRVAGLQAIQNAEEAGVTVCYGSDMVGAMQPFQTNEFVTRASVLPPAVVYKQATTNGADLVGHPKTLGTITTVGAFADILILQDCPFGDVTIFDRPAENLLAIIKDGRVVRSRVDGLEVEIPL